jgi:hypothetical protein
MKNLALCCLILIAPLASAADSFVVTVKNALAAPRPSETIVIPFAEVKRRLPTLAFDQVGVKDAQGRIIASQVIGYTHSHKGPQEYGELVFQHDFAANEATATFTVEALALAPKPFETKVFARYVPERWDDFAWENDRMAHRAYGPAIELPAAGKDQMTSSGLDLWTKKVHYPIVDRWYHKGHDGLHTDTGEGLDMYEVGMNRGAGGTGIWDGRKLAVSKNFRTWKIFANGPIRAVFELGYEPWDAGNGVTVAETKRFTVDAGHQLDEVASTFTFTPSTEPLTAAIGVSLHTTIATVASTRNERQHAFGVWEKYQAASDGTLGVGVVLDPDAAFAGFAELPATPDVPRLIRPELMILAKVKSGEPLRYYVGGAWVQTRTDVGNAAEPKDARERPDSAGMTGKAGDVKTQREWNAYLDAWAVRLRSPLTVTYSTP